MVRSPSSVTRTRQRPVAASAPPEVFNLIADWLRNAGNELDKVAQTRGGPDASYRRWRAGYADPPLHEPDCPARATGIPLVGCVGCEWQNGAWL